jgi:hypothetical protein
MHLESKEITALGCTVSPVFFSMQYPAAWNTDVMADGYRKTVYTVCRTDIHRFDGFSGMKEKFCQ